MEDTYKGSKTFVIDTNVLLVSPEAINAFGENEVIIPDVVLDELEKFKKDKSELGANARYIARLLDKLRHKGSLISGIQMENGGLLKIEMNHTNVKEGLPEYWDKNSGDFRILQVCKGLIQQGKDITLISNDIYERIKADVLGINATHFDADNYKASSDEHLYNGRCEVYTTEECMNKFYDGVCLMPEEIFVFTGEDFHRQEVKLEINEFLLIATDINTSKTALGRFDGKAVVPLYHKDEHPYGTTAKNAGQNFILEALLADASQAPLVIIKGPSGTGKTFLALAAGLQKVWEENRKEYRKILVLRPNVKLDEDLGFLPGSELEKIFPFLRPITDNLEELTYSDKEKNTATNKDVSEKEGKDLLDELFTRKIISAEAVAYMRGRSIPNHWIIVDEAQNLTPLQAKALVTRAGKGTKIILIGDPDQVDVPYFDSYTNGLSFTSNRMKGSKLCWQLSLTEGECERSDLAEEAIKRM